MAKQIPDEIRELGEMLGMSYALRIQALGSPAAQKIIETLGKLKDTENLRESQNSGCQNGQCRRPVFEELFEGLDRKG